MTICRLDLRFRTNHGPQPLQLLHPGVVSLYLCEKLARFEKFYAIHILLFAIVTVIRKLWSLCIQNLVMINERVRVSVYSETLSKYSRTQKGKILLEYVSLR